MTRFQGWSILLTILNTLIERENHMLSVNPFAILAETVSPIFMQSFVVLMIVLIAVGTLVDIIHKKNVKYFFENAKKAKLSATKTLSTGKEYQLFQKQ